MARNAAITGWGAYLPSRILRNQDLEGLVDTSDEWIRTRTGIHRRHLAGPGETTASMCVAAGRLALERAQLSPRDLDLVICATTTPDHLLPATACLVQQKLGADHAGAFDINCACTGFLAGLIVGSQFIQTGSSQCVLVVAGETLSRFLDWQDRNTCVLFGDGAAGVVLEATTQKAGLLSSVMGSRGDVDKLLSIEAGGCARPASAESLADKAHFLRMRGNELFKIAVRAMAQASNDALAKAHLSLDDIRAVIPHQANLRIITATQEALGIPAERMVINVAQRGNTGASSVPIALAEYVSGQPLQAGDNILMVGFGGGLTWAAAVLRWADIAALMQQERCSTPIIHAPHFRSAFTAA